MLYLRLIRPRDPCSGEMFEETMSQAQKRKQNFLSMTLEDAMKLIGQVALTPWRLTPTPVPQSANLEEVLRRFESFDLTSSEAAKMV